MAYIRDAVKRGWKLGDDGLLTRNGVVAKPGHIMPSRGPGEPGYNPRTDPPAVSRFGGEFVSDNRYLLPTGLFCDRNGALWAEEDCPVCAGAGFVKTLKGLSPWAKAWEFNLTYCRECWTPQEIEQAEFEKSTAQMRAAPRSTPWRRSHD